MTQADRVLPERGPTSPRGVAEALDLIRPFQKELRVADPADRWAGRRLAVLLVAFHQHWWSLVRRIRDEGPAPAWLQLVEEAGLSAAETVRLLHLLELSQAGRPCRWRELESLASPPRPDWRTRAGQPQADSRLRSRGLVVVTAHPEGARVAFSPACRRRLQLVPGTGAGAELSLKE